MRVVLFRASQNVVRLESALGNAHAFIFTCSLVRWGRRKQEDRRRTNRRSTYGVLALFAAALMSAMYLSHRARATLPRTHPVPSTARPSTLSAFKNVVRTRAPRLPPLRLRQLRLACCCNDEYDAATTTTAAATHGRWRIRSRSAPCPADPRWEADPREGGDGAPLGQRDDARGIGRSRRALQKMDVGDAGAAHFEDEHYDFPALHQLPDATQRRTSSSSRKRSRIEDQMPGVVCVYPRLRVDLSSHGHGTAISASPAPPSSPTPTPHTTDTTPRMETTTRSLRFPVVHTATPSATATTHDGRGSTLRLAW
ncbi:hypothetical protein C8R45DRAFT_1110030 [Mycena sanguinolenta]|nr:hypothetical protein C8R45DRAFT_1110030 [Mycena sanguinolenta]